MKDQSVTMPGGKEWPVVLVVEDEPILRMCAVDIVEDAGFEALEAADAQQAIDILEHRPDIRIVFSDIDMPGGIDGVTLAAAIRDRWPPIGIILTSGYLMPDMRILPGQAVFFSKPYMPEKIAQALYDMSF
ncbi:response regulator [Palleronia sp. LCG004]|uniref:response regulator n=1 Tax=Palleronia sp. LCG004 TaxID=3079304 RepID=UPI002942BAE3|nr:response regulator [Palleronia sp. LCG004]WOI56094.1 response regulator [Palleronia sp. LCG004]